MQMDWMDLHIEDWIELKKWQININRQDCSKSKKNKTENPSKDALGKTDKRLD